MQRNILILILLITIFITVLISCKSKIDSFDPGLDERILAQRGTEAIDDDNFKLALLYFKAIIDNPPDNSDKNIWASYEIANIHYKMEEYITSLELLDAIILEYQKEEAVLYPEAPLILANIIKEKILINEDYLKDIRRLQKNEEETEEVPEPEVVPEP